MAGWQMTPLRLTGRILRHTPTGPVQVARVLAVRSQESTGRWAHWVRLEFADSSHPHYSYNRFADLSEVMGWVDWYCRRSAPEQLALAWDNDPAPEGVA